MKKIKWAFLLAVLAGCLALAVGCAPVLDSPSALNIDEDALVLRWAAVDNATYYTVGINDSEYITSRTSYSLSSLEVGEYQLRVRACDARKEHRDSAWSESITFVKEDDGGMTLTLINANTAYEVTGAGNAFGDVTIPATYRGIPVVSIADRAFYSSSGITSVTIPDSVTSIGENAFMNCSALERVTIPDSVTSIGASAFQSCRALTEIVLPAGLTSLSDYTFRYCRNLVSVQMGDALTSIGVGAFTDCERLAAVDIPDAVTSIGESAFDGCEALRSADLGSGVTSLGASAFAGCGALETVTGGSALETVGEYAFLRCGSLSSIVIPETVTAISAHAFSECGALAQISIGTGVTSIGEGAFEGTRLIEQYENHISYAGNWAIGNDGEITASPSFREGTVGIASNAFYESRVTSVAFPDSVKYIGDYAFYHCENLYGIDLNRVVSVGRYAFADCAILGRSGGETVRFGTALETIGSYAFYNTTDLRSAQLPDTLQSIGTYAFYRSGIWTNTDSGIVYLDDWVVGYVEASSDAAPGVISIRNGTVGIADYAFYNCTTISSITIAYTVEKIGTAAFYGCSSLSYVSVDFSGESFALKEVGDYAFYKCEMLTGIYLPESVEKIGRSAFYKTGLTEITLPATLTEIGPYAFYGCSALTDVSFREGASLQTVGMYAFANCTALTSVSLPDSVTTIANRAFSQCRAMTSVSLGNSLTSLGDYAFYYCLALTEITLPDSLTYVSGRAFYRCSGLTSVTFGENVTSIGDYAFYGCTSLAGVSFPAALTEIGAYAFRSCSALTSVILPEHVAIVGIHAFNGAKSLTVYCEAASAPQGWDARWNSGYRPVVWGCTLSEDEQYVLSFVKTEDAILNADAVNGFSDPVRAGYTFAGWRVQTESGERTVAWTELSELADGTTLTAVWTPAPEEPPAETPEEQA